MKVSGKKYNKILEYYPEEESFLTVHCKQVTKLAIQLFKKTRSLHHLGKKEKEYLKNASLLHDIGYTIDGISHNKHSFRFIMQNPNLPWGKKTRKVIACIARYHRGPFPKQTHKIFGKLSEKKQRIVTVLSALLRIADGLDYTHQNSVKSLNVIIKKDKVTFEIICRKGTEPTTDIERGKKKSDLFTHIFQLKDVIFLDKGGE